jgi:DNA-directed RNA polymerase specialized sigma24 family protein
MLVADDQVESLLAVNEALECLAGIQRRAAQVAELRIFLGMTNEEIAANLGVCERTVKRDWEFAQAWLMAEIQRRSGPQVLG